MKKIFLVLSIFVLTLTFACDQEKQEEQVYLFSYFIDNGQDGLHLAYSFDALNWTALNNGSSFLTPTAGQDKLMRDPCIIQGPDGKFHMVWTVSWGEKGIGLASSRDLIHWSEQTYIPVMEHEPKALNCWAPEIFWDETTQQYMIFWSTTIPGRFPETDGQSSQGPPEPGKNHRIYYVTSKDLLEFSETKLLYDHGFNVIDATLLKDGDRYIMFIKDETNKPFKPQKNIRVAFGDHVTGPYSPPSDPITGDYWCEGPTAIKIDDTYYVYFDRYREDRFGAVRSDDLETWTDITEQLHFPQDARHGTIFRVSRDVLQKLKNL
ncbi:family 43 glycosylhydrolase [candidate division KSB1 bacterium]|nr:family 43 glycosylhydrolase [candidate division KSB1 bacterium]